MKRLLIALVFPVIILASGCNQKNEEIAKLKATNDSLMAIGFEKDSTVIQFVDAFNSIQSNLDSIKMKENIINKTVGDGSEIKTRTKDQINSDINMIYKMQQENRVMVASLRSKLKNSGVHAAGLELMINNLTKQIEEKDVQIAQLKDDLTKVNIQVTDLNTKVTDLNANVDNLNTANNEKQAVIEAKTAELNTAYYVVSTPSDLQEKKIITKTGGFIGLGKTKGLAPNMDKSYFNKIDITKLNGISIMKNKATVLTSHPKSSYHLTGKNLSDSLVITNQAQFWSLSKVLVVSAK
jgi:hypothetical protein